MNANLAMALAAAAGMCIALQAAANAKLRGMIGHPVWATYFSILGTLACSSLYVAVTRPEMPSLASVRSTTWWHWSGGLLGALVVSSGTFLVPTLGAAKFIAFVVAGQLTASLLLDHYALMGLPAQELTVGKIVGAGLIVAGVVCMKYL